MSDQTNGTGSTGPTTTGEQPDQARQRAFDPSEAAAPDALDAMATADIGRRIENFISPRSFVSQEWCLQNVAPKPVGYHVAVGRIAGVCTAVERRESSAPVKPGDKPMPPSVWIRGQFECTTLVDGEVRAATWLILPRSAGELVEAAFQAGATRAMLDLELGVEATGRSIPYRYTVTAYTSRETEDQRLLTAIRARQEARAAAREQRQLGGPSDPKGKAIDA